MSSINSSAYYSVGGNTSQNNGISGLMSGMDTESMVKKMLMGTQNKIDKQEATKLQTQWKRDVYRDMISSINSFKNKYFNKRFDADVKNNFASNDFFNSMISKVTSGSAAKIISTDSSAATGDFRLKVEQLAESAKLESAASVSQGTGIEGKMLTEKELGEFFEESITLDITTKSGDTETSKTVKIALNDVKTEEDLTKAVSGALNIDYSGKLEVSTYNGKLRITSKDENVSFRVSKDSSSLGLAMTGIAGMKISDVTGGKMYEADSPINMNAGKEINVTLDGVTKTINLKDVQADSYDADGNMLVKHDKVVEELNKELKKAFGDSIEATTVDGKIKLDIKGDAKGHDLRITGAGTLALGIEAGSANHINLSSKLSQLPGVSGSKYSFSINGTDFNFDSDTTIATMMNEINNSDAGVKMTYSALDDKFKLGASSSGANYGIEIEQSEGNALSVMFGEGVVAAGGKASSKYLTTGEIAGTNLADGFKTNEISMNMKVNGKDYTFELKEKKDSDGKVEEYTKDDIERELNSWLKSKFKEENITYKDGKFAIKDGFVVEFSKAKVDPMSATSIEEGKKHDLAYALGINVNENSNIANENTAVTDILQLKDKGFTGKVGDFNTEGVSFEDGRLTISGSSDVTFTNETLKNLFGDSVKLGNGTSNKVVGKDAKVILNGVETTRSSNTFTIDGMTLQVTELSKEIDGKPGEFEETVISTERDNEQIVEGFKSFVKDYNDMIKKLNGLISEDDEYKEYPPLTAEQKKEMSETEIKLWEEKSKKGLVRNDEITSDFLSQMRNLIYTKPEENSLALYQIGIETTRDYKDGGQIQLDEKALINAINQSPDQVRNLFMDAQEGLSKGFMDIIDDVASERLSDPGLLVQSAGVKGGTTEKVNTMYDNLRDIDIRIKDLKAKYEKEKARYWKQFNSMESIMANFSSQSAMISQQFGGM